LRRALSHSPLAALLLLLLVIGQLSCASVDPKSQAVAALGRSARQVLVLPLNVIVRFPEEVEGAGEDVFGTLTRVLRRNGMTVETLPLSRAMSLLQASAAEARAQAGETPQFSAVAARLAGKLAESHQFDAILIPSILVHKVKLQGNHVIFSGVTRKVQHAGQAPELMESSGVGSQQLVFRGVVDAASFYVVILDAEGRKLRDARGGLDLLDQIQFRDEEHRDIGERQYRILPRRVPLDDLELVQEGIEVALGPFLAKGGN